MLINKDLYSFKNKDNLQTKMRGKAQWCFWILILLPFCLLSQQSDGLAEKKLFREWPVSPDGKVEVHNLLGNIDVVIGQPGQVKMEMRVTIKDVDQHKAEYLLDQIQFKFEEDTNRVSATTAFDQKKIKPSVIATGKVDYDIHYHLTVPADLYLHLTNQYGNIFVETTNRDLTVDLSFGKIELGDVNGNLKLNLSDGSGRISQISKGDLQLSNAIFEMEDASDMTIDMSNSTLSSGTFQNLNLISSKSQWKANRVNQLEYRGDKDSITIDEAGKIKVRSRHSTIKFEELIGDAGLEMRYGELSLFDILPSFSIITLNSSFTDVSLQFKPETGFTIDALTKYCPIIFDELKVSENIEKHRDRKLKATKGIGNNQVLARMNYGSLQISVAEE